MSWSSSFVSLGKAKPLSYMRGYIYYICMLCGKPSLEGAASGERIGCTDASVRVRHPRGCVAHLGDAVLPGEGKRQQASDIGPPGALGHRAPGTGLCAAVAEHILGEIARRVARGLVTPLPGAGVSPFLEQRACAWTPVAMRRRPQPGP